MRKPKVSILLVIAAVTLIGSSYSDTAIAASDVSYYFVETGYTVKGAFLNYWEQNGGLMRQGYPITDEMTEISDLDGKTYTMQYFERAVFEYHPENQPLYDVLLSQLGTSRYKQKYPNGPPAQTANPNFPITFPQTGQTIGGVFRQYWEQNGSLAQFGYPITNEFAEVSNLNGQTYTVQYFERAVFEYHPENRPPYNVLLSQLGRFRYEVRGNPQLISGSAFGNPVATGNYLFWIDYRQGHSIYGYDLSKQEEFLVTDKPGARFSLASDSKTLTWVETPSSDVINRGSIQGYDIASGKQFTILPSTSTSIFDNLALDSGMLYYHDATIGHIGLYARNLNSEAEQLVSAAGRGPVAADGVLLWSEQRQFGPMAPSEWSLHLRKLDGSISDKVVVKDEGQFAGYSVSGDKVVWSFYPPAADTRVYLYSISSGVSKPISALANPPLITSGPLVSGNKVVWASATGSTPNQSNQLSIQEYDIDSGATSTLFPNTPTPLRPGAIIGQTALAYTSGTMLYLLNLK